MQEFRPASVIDADTALAASFREGDESAVRTLVERYSPAVTALAVRLLGDESRGRAVATDVFVEAWRVSGELEPDRDLGPWLASITRRLAQRAGSTVRIDDDDATRTWVTASATSRLAPDQFVVLASYYLDGTEPDDEAAVAAGQVRLERRLAHLPRSEGAGSLSDPISWIVPDPDLAARVVDAVRSESGEGSHRSDESQIASAAGSRRRLPPAVIGVGAALAVLLGAIVVLSALSGSPEREDVVADLVPTGLLADVDGGEITVIERDAGLEIDLDAPTLPRRAGNSFYRAVLVLDDDSEITIGSFNEGVDVTLWGGVGLERVRSFQVVEGDLGVEGDTAEEPGEASQVVLKGDVVAA